jgi:ABC-type multidrug transport system fused ATPase/permease subunit
MSTPSTGLAPGLGNGALIKRLLALTWRHRIGCLKVMSLQVLLLAISLSGLGLTGLGIDFIRKIVQPGARAPHWPFGLAPPSEWSPMTVVAAIAGTLMLFALVRAVLNFTYTVELSRLLQRDVVATLRTEVYAKLQRLSFRFFDDNASGSIINRVTSDVQATRLFIDGVIMQGLIMILSLAFYLIYMTSLHAGLTLICLSTTPLLILVSAAFARMVRPAYAHNRTLVDKMLLVISESLQGIQVIKAFAREPETDARFAAAVREVRDQKVWIINRLSIFTPLIGFLTDINIIILLGYGGYLVIQGELPLGAGMVVFAGLLQQFSSQVANISNIANSIQESLTAARRVFEVLDAPIEIASPPNAVLLPRSRGIVEFHHVWFGYNPETMVLRDVTFKTQPGQCIAVLGTTGSGKSTLLSMIPRFYDPDRGTVLIDGLDARRYNLDDLRRNVGIVFQENFLFSNTVAANIAFGNPQASPAQIERAARIASAHDFIMGLRDGYNTVLAEGGSDLSGGQRQRLAIARAILLDPAILLLDDPTAAIDPQTEHEIMSAMDNAMLGRTTFVVAHRLSTLRRANWILVLDHGRIIQAGTHDQLMATKGPYQRQAAMQVVDDESLRMLNIPVDVPGTGGTP